MMIIKKQPFWRLREDPESRKLYAGREFVFEIRRIVPERDRGNRFVH